MQALAKAGDGEQKDALGRCPDFLGAFAGESQNLGELKRGRQVEEIALWVKENQLLSGAGVTLLSGAAFVWRKISGGKSGESSGSSNIIVNNSNSLNIQASAEHGPAKSQLRGSVEKGLVRILFVDDDTRFQVIRMMKGAGWHNVKITKDIKDLNAPEVLEAQIFFVDIQGVGKSLGFADEGLGLSLELKRKYPEKKVVIYSAQTDGDRFHRALNKADGSLSKNAEPYQFIALVEELLGEK
jgi:hypothetical protein